MGGRGHTLRCQGRYLQPRRPRRTWQSLLHLHHSQPRNLGLPKGRLPLPAPARPSGPELHSTPPSPQDAEWLLPRGGHRPHVNAGPHRLARTPDYLQPSPGLGPRPLHSHMQGPPPSDLPGGRTCDQTPCDPLPPHLPPRCPYPGFTAHLAPLLETFPPAPLWARKIPSLLHYIWTMAAKRTLVYNMIVYPTSCYQTSPYSTSPIALSMNITLPTHPYPQDHAILSHSLQHKGVPNIDNKPLTTKVNSLHNVSTYPPMTQDTLTITILFFPPQLAQITNPPPLSIIIGPKTPRPRSRGVTHITLYPQETRKKPYYGNHLYTSTPALLSPRSTLPPHKS